MTLRLIAVGALGLYLLLTASSSEADDDEYARPIESSREFNESLEVARSVIGMAEFETALKSPILGSRPPEALEGLVDTIRRETPVPGVALGKVGSTYDVILQPGHYRRPPGKVGTTGQKVSERALAAYITGLIARELEKRNHNVLIVSADQYIRDSATTPAYEGLSATAFLAVHLDGSPNPCSSGPSMGYADSSSMVAMHQLKVALAIAFGYSYDDYKNDNFTVNLSEYYMFKHVKSNVMRGILEVGELTCPQEEAQLILTADTIASNAATALHFIVEREKAARKQQN